LSLLELALAAQFNKPVGKAVFMLMAPSRVEEVGQRRLSGIA
jgi:hypothetical protein